MKFNIHKCLRPYSFELLVSSFWLLTAYKYFWVPEQIIPITSLVPSLLPFLPLPTPNIFQDFCWYSSHPQPPPQDCPAGDREELKAFGLGRINLLTKDTFSRSTGFKTVDLRGWELVTAPLSRMDNCLIKLDLLVILSPLRCWWIDMASWVSWESVEALAFSWNERAQIIEMISSLVTDSVFNECRSTEQRAHLKSYTLTLQCSECPTLWINCKDDGRAGVTYSFFFWDFSWTGSSFSGSRCSWILERNSTCWVSRSMRMT